MSTFGAMHASKEEEEDESTAQNNKCTLCSTTGGPPCHFDVTAYKPDITEDNVLSASMLKAVTTAATHHEHSTEMTYGDTLVQKLSFVLVLLS